MDRNKGNKGEIDENFILASIKGGKRTVEDEPRAQTTHSSSKDPKPAGEYEALFLRESDTTTRSGKAINIRKEYHDLLTKIVQVIGENNVSLFSYVDNVLAHHFDQFKDEIKSSYDKKNSSIF